jgi:hypothetical protein
LDYFSENPFKCDYASLQLVPKIPNSHRSQMNEATLKQSHASDFGFTMLCTIFNQALD